MTDAIHTTDAIASFAPADRTLPAMLAQQCARFAERTLLVAGEQRWTYAQALHLAQRSAALLQAQGIQAGDRVALLCSNRPEFLQFFLGCAWMGAITVPINSAARGAIGVGRRSFSSPSGKRWRSIGAGARPAAVASRAA